MIGSYSAMALTAGFYGIAGAPFAVAVLPWAFGGRGNPWMSLIAIMLGVLMLVAIFPRRVRFAPSGVLLTPSSQPRLLALVHDEARACGARPPDEVYATLDVNAGVLEAGRRRRVLLIGLPLVRTLSERGLRGVIAHELGHCARGDTWLVPWIQRFREASGSRSRRLLRMTSAISRRRELAADAHAARRAGRNAYGEALRRVHAYAAAVDAYWYRELATGPFDSHPSLAERLAALERCPEGEPDDSGSAAALVRDPAALETALLARLVVAGARTSPPAAERTKAPGRLPGPSHNSLDVKPPKAV
jgi:Zn-dependent protease with chaperone function